MLRVVRRLSCAVPTRYSAAKHGRGRTLAELSSNKGMKIIALSLYIIGYYIFLLLGFVMGLTLSARLIRLGTGHICAKRSRGDTCSVCQRLTRNVEYNVSERDKLLRSTLE